MSSSVYRNPFLWLVFVAFIVAGIWLRLNWSWQACLVIAALFAVVLVLNVMAGSLGTTVDHSELDTERREKVVRTIAEGYAEQAKRRESAVR